ncbi:hypothetical protein ACMAZE_08490 [Pseudopelagicola sp. nBUS_20]|uniref:hypothetical protein n=1 Tax=Pseudopelagicola sp. nBUS_20 TaxID=3395317 RepID=UPI003EC03F13
MADYRSTDRLIPLPEADWAQVSHGDCIEYHGEVLIADLLRLRENAVANFGSNWPRIWKLWRDSKGNWHAFASAPGTGFKWWSEAVTYRCDRT